MRVLHGFAELAVIPTPVCLAIGVFDGVHRGHQSLIRQVVADAHAAAGAAVVLTFDPHPARVLHPGQPPALLTALPHKLRLIEQLGADACLVVTFDRRFAATSPEEFIATVVRHTPRLREICVGARFRFGHNRAGDARLIATLAVRHGFHAREIPPVTIAGEPISSTAVRQCVHRGDLDRAAAMLDRPFAVTGVVVAGDDRGKQLGYPTANLRPHHDALPPEGVYAVQVIGSGLARGGVANLGRRPTFAAGGERVLETHLWEFQGNLYGQELEVRFLKRLRAEQKFPSRDALRAQIVLDVAAARAICG